jgi:peptidoglycan/xylan/chitin deacetylase (PgdA/CDA1 family)
LALKDDLKMTYAVIPARLGPNDIKYLQNLDKSHFELAAHGYSHEKLKNLSYQKQYSIINNSTEAMENIFHVRPYTFVPPFGAVDDNTLKACLDLGYHSVLMPYDNPTKEEKNLIQKFSWESKWHPGVKHRSFINFKSSFDSDYNSSSEVFLMILHPNTFILDNKSIDRNLVDDFNKSIDYMKNKHVKFETVETLYQQKHNMNEFQPIVYGHIDLLRTLITIFLKSRNLLTLASLQL